MDAEFCSVVGGEWVGEGLGVADVLGGRAADAFVSPALGDFGRLEVAEEDADADAGICLGGEELEHGGAFEEEEAA